jgi:thiol-disulfide isomerase/thioredoxin
MKTQVIIILFFLTVISGCSLKPPIYGTISGLEEGGWKPVIYLIDPSSWSNVASSYMGTVVDSFRIDEDGQFAIKAYKMPDIPEHQVLQLAIQKKGEAYPNQLNNDQPAKANYFPIVYKNGEVIEVQADANRFLGSFSIKDPSPNNIEMLRLRDVSVNAFREFLSEKEDTGGHDRLLHQERAKLNYQKSLLQFSQDTRHLLPGLIAIRWASVEAYYERIPELIFAQAEKWKNHSPNHPWVQELLATASKEGLPVMVGDEIPNYPLPLLAGDTIPLHQLLGSRLTILDLWASWCAPCRKENRDVLGPLWEEYHLAGLEIVGYALEAERATWIRAIEKDQAGRWWQASHLNGDDAPLFEALRIQTIPANFILDKGGKVLAKNLHGGELAVFVSEYLEQTPNKMN